MITRRTVLRLTGMGTLLLAAGAGGFALTRTPDEALRPWRRAGADHDDPRLRALSYAVLAPNPHNLQSWLVELIDEDEFVLYVDPERLLPATDPFDRQIVIGLGCFLELARMAAAEDGYDAVIEPFPLGMDKDHLDGRPIARVRLQRSEAVRRDLLFAHVQARRSTKTPYDTDREIADDVLSSLAATKTAGVAIAATNDPVRVARLRDLSYRAHELEMRTPATLKESVDVMRIGKAEANAHPDGIYLGGAMMEAMNLAGIMTREALGDPDSIAFKMGLDMFRDIMGSAMGHLWLVTEGNSRIDQLQAGASWVRINLQATALGIALHPMSQALQEYEEMDALAAELRQELGVRAPARIQMFGRLGYVRDSADPTPRWPIETRLIGA